MGQRVIDKNDQYNEIKKYFKTQFWNENQETTSSFIGELRPLNIAISKDEIEKAVYKTINNAVGEDKIPMELINYAPESVLEKISQI